MNEKETLLADAVGTVKQRGEQYGNTFADFSQVVALWEVVLPHVNDLKPHHVALAMICVKLSRLHESPGHRDNWLDIAGYAACGWECAVKEAQK